ncbi:MAG: hypothetical protein A3A61_02425 [Candidatus Woykebacteria bacterium RIFCSPLOWO2_01_FULL_43_14]|uniref:Glutamate/phenylalanine/leucine/valine/L-tryptophan dehydrogenase C-terminal domain-containing protein n=2 Tax=Candidatus Woykeibacteriota TaxID=1817899 RepID=A0A1G1WVW3_9BACT|nr:MAG: hypothetical protein A3J50_01435 [Candidatus Woykebacteria bacterium RIFCSPHIGHO2_02_FULL_43_16b]OGY31844.1 MAG: hypothetical protein A3A61_02425 [Candidatus Woykebacteria bacterium RIFCSPLOWO2_01_FULL_43_14]
MKQEKHFSLESLESYDDHKLVASFYSPKTNLKGFVAIHRGGLTRPAFGATRIWHYDSEEEALQDSLKLSKTMTYKLAMAQLKYGGAKAVIISPNLKAKEKQILLRSYGNWLNYLAGHLITGADVGIDPKDLEILASEYKGIVGRTTDAVKFTSLGVFYSIELTLKELYGSEDIAGKRFSIQGVGKVGLELLKMLDSQAEKIYISDIDRGRLNMVRKQFPNVEITSPKEIHKQKVDIFSPCALSNAINRNNVSSLGCKAIVGSANSQLEGHETGEVLNRIGILYAPDYIVNAGGVIAVVDEYENPRYSEKRILDKVKNIKETLRVVFAASKSQNKATNITADEQAEKVFNKIV